MNLSVNRNISCEICFLNINTFLNHHESISIVISSSMVKLPDIESYQTNNATLLLWYSNTSDITGSSDHSVSGLG